MTREVIVNGRFLARRITGVERYGREVLRLIGDKCRVERPARAYPSALGHAWEQFILPGRINSRSILWSPANTGPLFIRDQVLTIHDLSPLEHPEWFRRGFAVWYRLFLPMLARRVQKILVPSEYVKRKLAMRLGVDALVTCEGVDAMIFNPNAGPTPYELPKKYILFVGSLEPRKNLPLLLSAWKKIKNDFQDTSLVIAGAAGNVFRPVNMEQMERVCYPGYVSDSDLPALYAHATLFVLPSKEEGFGLPALEAMACGTPVIVSDGGALPETVGDAAQIFGLSEPDGLATAMQECLSFEGLRTCLKEKGFAQIKKYSWQNTAALIWKTLHEI